MPILPSLIGWEVRKRTLVVLHGCRPRRLFILFMLDREDWCIKTRHSRFGCGNNNISSIIMGAMLLAALLYIPPRKVYHHFIHQSWLAGGWRMREREHYIHTAAPSLAKLYSIGQENVKTSTSRFHAVLASWLSRHWNPARMLHSRVATTVEKLL